MYRIIKKIGGKTSIRLFLTSSFLFLIGPVFSQNVNISPECKNSDRITLQQVQLDANNISTWIINTGIFNQDRRVSNTPGFQWPKGSGKFAIFSSGLCIGAYVNTQLKEAVASWTGEYEPGYVSDTAGYPIPRRNYSFKIYKVTRTDHNSTDWLNWGNMVPRGAPYIDVNLNGIYEPSIDTPGVSGAEQTVFVCLTDGFALDHKMGEGFGGGTLPLYAELHLTAWAYNSPGLADIQFFKWVVINRCDSSWEKTYFAIFSDCDLGYNYDDYNGCDTALQLAYTYNSSDTDGNGQGVTYGLHPPAVGIQLLRSPVNKHLYPPKNLGMTSCGFVKGISQWGAICEKDPIGEQLGAYNMMRGYKKDETPWVIPPGGIDKKTKFCFSGDPESGYGWNEGLPGNPSGCVLNCGGPSEISGPVFNVVYPGERRFILGSGAENFRIVAGDTQTIVIAQMIARGTNNLNSVTRLKQLAANVKAFYDENFQEPTLPVTYPDRFRLYQNYPNPFNLTTRIKFDIPDIPVSEKEIWGSVTIKIYDILGHKIATLINGEINAGIHEVTWDATNYSSGIYFFILQSGSFSESKKMLLIK